MTETEATYKTGEPLPECETGSVERMLEAAIEWSEKLEPRNSTSMPGFKVYECETQNPVQIAPSQTQLLRNILAKAKAAASADTIYDGPIVFHRSCPHCHGAISATLFRNMVKKQTCTTHRQVCLNCNAWLRIESKLYG